MGLVGRRSQELRPRSTTTDASDAELDALRRQLRVADVLREHSQTLLLAAAGEEPMVTARALHALAAALGAEHVQHLGLPSEPNETHSGSSGSEPAGAIDAAATARWLQAQLQSFVDPEAGPRTRTRRHEFGASPEAPGKPPHTDNGCRVEWAIAPMADAGEQGAALCVGRDARRPWRPWELEALGSLAHVQQQVKRRLAAEHQLSAMFHNAPTGITLRDGNGNLVDCNQAFLDFLGLDSELAILGSGPMELLASEELPDEFFEMLGLPGSDGVKPIELPYRCHASNEIVWGRVSSAALSDDNNWLWVTHIEDVTREVERRRLMQERATSDPVTGLANRHQLLDTLEEQLNSAQRGVEYGLDAGLDLRAGPGQQRAAPDAVACGVALLDLDGFKSINDTLGHDAGDRLLVEVGQRLRRTVRRKDVVGRYGGDEFVVILTGPTGARVAQRLVSRLSEVFEAEFDVEGERVTINASVGLALAQPGDTPAALITRADRAMYADKATHMAGSGLRSPADELDAPLS